MIVLPITPIPCGKNYTQNFFIVVFNVMLSRMVSNPKRIKDKNGKKKVLMDLVQSVLCVRVVCCFGGPMLGPMLSA
jgi:hypothetical protein